MCMYSIDKEMQILTRPKTVYVVKVIFDDNSIRSILYNTFIWEIGKMYKTTLNKSNNIGFYSFHNKKTAIKYLVHWSNFLEGCQSKAIAVYKAEIPSNSFVYKGTQKLNYRKKQVRAYLSDSLILKKLIYKEELKHS